MGYDYALVHLKYTIPPALALSILYRPLLTRLDVYKICFLITIAVVSTLPWDSYLIRHRIWTYPPDVIIGPTILQIPLEEVFFFVIQTYNTTLLYLMFNKPTLHSIYLRAERGPNHPEGPLNQQWKHYRWGGQVLLFFTLLAAYAFTSVLGRKDATYMSLIIWWAAPFLLLLWSLGYQFLVGLPFTNTILPIALPTVYLWIVDCIALRRGTWVIENGTKLGIHLTWFGLSELEIEEAVFFLVTNMLIVFGQVAFDNALAVINTFSSFGYAPPALPSPLLLVQALLKPASEYDQGRIDGLREAVNRLRQKSRSFYLASGAFEGKLRIYLIMLYSFCRVADDLIDEASSLDESQKWLNKLEEYLDRSCDEKESDDSITAYIRESFPKWAHSALLMLPTKELTAQPLYDLLRGFEMDLVFCSAKSDPFPIACEADLQLYSARVAGTVAQMCLELVFALLPSHENEAARRSLIQAGSDMGVALQYVNISRDIEVDAQLGRVYLPTDWLKEMSLTPKQVIQNPRGPKIDALRRRLLDKAFAIYEESKGAIERLPQQAKGPMRVAVESYMEIGRVLREGHFQFHRGRATVPKIRRLRVAWQTLLRS
ncbi:Lycopene beta-cyclase [Tothia fuscella]|uniref:Bifunctional lycopene cyclase/phytoene synthase n=1 Tax=Tothia fuscella TaxID=1048955 RepID=A0A9P4P2C8_9PEZI|nr:Lycopene beta-cyclase [Tothia fuscella]